MSVEKLSFKVAEFEGPLDLLLHLISQHKIDICDIPIAMLLDQYLAYLEEMRYQNLEIASEFLEMAARLVHIKTAMLLPRHEEAEELKEELKGMLLEYKLCKQIAQKLKDASLYGETYIRKPAEIPEGKIFTGTASADALRAAYLAAAGKSMRKLPPSPTAFTGIVAKKVVSVESRLLYILRRLYKEKEVSYRSLFISSDNRSEMVATFLALLELMKAGRLNVTDDSRTVEFREKESTEDGTVETSEYT